MKVLVTGGGGLIGRRVVELLLERGDAVRILARSRYPEVAALGAEALQGDVRDPAAVDAAVDGVDAVVHVAGKAGLWGRVADYRSINVDGTRRVLEATQRRGVGRLVFTSSPSVVGYERDIEGGGADLPHAGRHESHYARTKAEAERLVLAANGADELATVALRPHLVVGPGDRNLLPRMLRRARAGRLVRVGDGTNRVDITYVDNAAWAHLDALDALAGPDAPCAGRAYFVSNDEPVGLWTWLGEVLAAAGAPPPRRRLPLWAARGLGALCEAAWTLLPLSGEPPLTRFLASALARAHWYDLGPAKRDLGYRVRVPLAEGTRRLVAWLRSRQNAAAPSAGP